MLDFFLNYALFFLKALTLLIAVVVGIGLILSLAARQRKGEGTFEIQNINERFDNIRASFEEEILSKPERKVLNKARKKVAKDNKDTQRPRLFVVRFEGDIRASAVSELRECVTALLQITHANDEVLVVLESSGGYVHQYGFAASQLKRFREHNIPLTVAIDKVAASGGYLMACVANTVLAAPFAIVGSIGVIGQIPNFHRLLDKHLIDVEQHTAGNFKRTLTMLGKNTDKGRQKFQEELEQTHQLFKDYIEQNRPQVDVAEVATGEHWHAIDAIKMKLIDSMITSDEYLLKQHPAKNIYEVHYHAKQHLRDRISSSLSALIRGAMESLSRTSINH